MMRYICTSDAATKIAQAGLVQKTLAIAAGISRYTLRNQLHRGHPTRAATARRIARVYAQATSSSETQALQALFEEIREPLKQTAAVYISTTLSITLITQVGLTQAAFARHADLDPALVNRILRQRQTVSGRLAWKVACAYATTRHIPTEQAFATLFTEVVF